MFFRVALLLLIHRVAGAAPTLTFRGKKPLLDVQLRSDQEPHQQALPRPSFGIFCLSGIEEDIEVTWRCDPFTCMPCALTASCESAEDTGCEGLCKATLSDCSRVVDAENRLRCVFLSLRDRCTPVCPLQDGGRCADVTVSGMPLQDYVTGFPASSDVVLLSLVGALCLGVILSLLHKHLTAKSSTASTTADDDADDVVALLNTGTASSSSVRSARSKHRSI